MQVMDRALVGWITSVQASDAARLPGQLVQLSRECQLVLQTELYLQYRAAPDGYAKYCSSPSVVTWHPRRPALASGGWAKAESELEAGPTLSMVAWLCRHLCEGYGLRSAGAEGRKEVTAAPQAPCPVLSVFVVVVQF